jgi:hypothetical protein
VVFWFGTWFECVSVVVLLGLLRVSLLECLFRLRNRVCCKGVLCCVFFQAIQLFLRRLLRRRLLFVLRLIHVSVLWRWMMGFCEGTVLVLSLLFFCRIRRVLWAYGISCCGLLIWLIMLIVFYAQVL